MDDKSTLLRVGQLAERVGKSTRALRLYEQMGILLPHSRTATGYRMYGEDAINQLMWIDKLQSLGCHCLSCKNSLPSLVSTKMGLQ